jgi:hypothetical protein
VMVALDGKYAVVHCDGDGYVIVSPDFAWVVTRGGNWSRNPFNCFRYDSLEKAEAALERFAKPRFSEASP